MRRVTAATSTSLVAFLNFMFKSLWQIMFIRIVMHERNFKKTSYNRDLNKCLKWMAAYFGIESFIMLYHNFQCRSLRIKIFHNFVNTTYLKKTFVTFYLQIIVVFWVFFEHAYFGIVIENKYFWNINNGKRLEIQWKMAAHLSITFDKWKWCHMNMSFSTKLSIKLNHCNYVSVLWNSPKTEFIDWISSCKSL